MIHISIEKNISDLFPNIKLGILTSKIGPDINTDKLWSIIQSRIDSINTKYSMEEIRKNNIIIESKKAYKLLGKDPNRYRLSSEALLKRIINNKGLYKINNAVDIINLVSIESGFSICGFNSQKIDGNIKLGIGNKDEDYLAIGRGKLNIENLPVFRDNIGAFGSPTSDSVRTQINNDCRNINIIIISFSGENKLLENLEKTSSLLEKYCSARAFDYYIM